MTLSRRFNNSSAYASIERLVPAIDGGDYKLKNTVAACRGCNSARPMIDYEEFKVLRLALCRKGWPECSFPSKEIRWLLRSEYGYPTGPLEIDNQQLVEMVK